MELVARQGFAKLRNSFSVRESEYLACPRGNCIGALRVRCRRGLYAWSVIARVFSPERAMKIAADANPRAGYFKRSTISGDLAAAMF
jgi:hypothetical protein